MAEKEEGMRKEKKRRKEKTGEGDVMIETERYKRQVLIWGEEGQAKINNSRVAIIGLDSQGKYAALACAALGIGNIVLIDGKDSHKGEMFLDKDLPEGPRALSFPEFLIGINRQISVEGYPSDLESRIDQGLLSGATAIVDATNSTRSKQFAINYGIEKGIPVLSTSSKWGYTKLMFYNPKKPDLACLMPMFEGHAQDELMGLVMCGPVTEEIKKIVLGEHQLLLSEPVRFNLGKGYRFGFPKDGEAPLPDPRLYENLKAAFFGGGGIGCWAAVLGAKMNFGTLDVFDYDKFEPHNINRQILGADGIGKLKAEHVANKIAAMSRGKTRSAGYNVLILPGFKTEKEYDLVFDFVDNGYTRAINTVYAIQNQIPMISAAALPESSRVISQVNGKTQCQNCVSDIYRAGREEEMIRRASCAANPNPSVVMANAIAGSLAMIETLSFVEPEKFGNPFNGELVYRSNSPTRFGTSPLNSPCTCYSKPVPDLKISQEDVDNFVKANPHLLRQQR